MTIPTVKSHDSSSSLESAIDFLDWCNAVDYVYMQTSSGSGSLRKVAQLAHKKSLKDFPEFRTEEYFQSYVEKQQFYLADDKYFSMDYVVPKSIAGKRRKSYLSVHMYILFCAHAIRIARMSVSLRNNMKASSDKSTSYYGSNIVFNGDDIINLDKDRHIYRSFYVEFRKDIDNNLPNFDIALRIDFQDFYENISIRILLDNLMAYVHHSEKLKYDMDNLRLEKFANFFEYCMRGKSGLPQADNNYMANYLSDLYLKFWDMDVIALLSSIKNIVEYKLIRYVDDTYMFIKFPSNTSRDLGNSRALEILERISDLTYYKFNLRINAKTQSYWLKDNKDIVSLRKKLKSTSVEGVYYRDKGETMPKLAKSVLETLTKISQSVSIEEYISDDSQIQESLKPLYDSDLQKLLMSRYNVELSKVLKELSIDKIKVAPLPILATIKLFPSINSSVKRQILKLIDLTNHDENLLESYIIINHESNWQNERRFKALARRIKSPHIKDLAGVRTKQSSIYKVNSSNNKSLLKIGDYPNFITHCRQRKLAEWGFRWSLALNHLLNELQMICHISGQPQDKLKAEEICTYLKSIKLSPDLIMDARRLFDRRNYNSISHAGDINKVIYAVSDDEYQKYNLSTAKTIYRLLEIIHKAN